MLVSFNIAAELDTALQTAAQAAGLEAAAFTPEMRAADPRHGDFQANGVLGYAKARKLNPRAVAESVLAALPAALRESFEVSIAGPGFINFKLKPATLLAWVTAYDSAEHLKSGAAALYSGQRYVVDFSSPNTAKQLHVGHIRGMVIGEAICRLLAFCGAEVIRDNHIGDWGTQFGKLIWGYQHLRNDAALATDPLEELERIYKAADAATKADPAILDAARAELVKLQAGDATNLALWHKINAISAGAFAEIYRTLGIRFDHQLGESFYNDKLPQVYTELAAAGLAAESQGALVVFHPEHPRFKTQPFIIRKSDGASNYASTDLATMLYRTEHFRADAIAILTDARQADHFEQLWLTTQKWFAQTNRRVPRFEHVSFGSILGEDGKAIKTRSGDPIKLKALLAEARSAPTRSSPKNPPSSPRPNAATSPTPWASAPCATPTSRRTAAATTSSPGTRSSPSRATPRPTCSTPSRASIPSSGKPGSIPTTPPPRRVPPRPRPPVRPASRASSSASPPCSTSPPPSCAPTFSAPTSSSWPASSAPSTPPTR
jgi:arginyl-tRNA synthetase